MWSFQAGPGTESRAERVGGRWGGKQDTVGCTKMVSRSGCERPGGGGKAGRGKGGRVGERQELPVPKDWHLGTTD